MATKSGRRSNNTKSKSFKIIKNGVTIPRWVAVVLVIITILVGSFFVYTTFALQNGDSAPQINRNAPKSRNNLDGFVRTEVACANGTCTPTNSSGARQQAYKRLNRDCPSGYQYRFRSGDDFKHNSEQWRCLNSHNPNPGPPTGHITNACGIEVDSSIQANICDLTRDAQRSGYTIGGGGFRNREAQIAARQRNGCPDIYTAPASSCATPTAIPGTSQHERGLAIDFTCNSDACWNWLRNNARNYGLINLPSEYWHYSTTGK